MTDNNINNSDDLKDDSSENKESSNILSSRSRSSSYVKRFREEENKNDNTSRNRVNSSSLQQKNLLVLKLIVASGQSHEFVVPLHTSVKELTQHVFDNWPSEWSEERENITSHHVLRIIYQGRFLHENITFHALNLSAGKKTVMHLVPREKLPEISTDETDKTPKSIARSCCCIVL